MTSLSVDDVFLNIFHLHKDKVWILLGKKLSGEASDDELTELNRLIKEDESINFSEETLDKLWKFPLIIHMDDQQENELLWSHLEGKMNRCRKRKWRIPIKRWAIAAGLILLLGSTLFLYTQRILEKKSSSQDQEVLHLNKIATPPNAKSKVELPDGSEVWINADSRLTYNSKDFGINNREVTLQGEAYFEVKQNARLPFIVHLKQVDIKVLGTAFNVKNYAKEKNIEATLLSGKIAVSWLNKKGLEVILKPDEKIVIPKYELPKLKEVSYNRGYKIEKIEKGKAVPTYPHLWKREKLVFDNRAFGQIAIEMERWYQVRIKFTDNRLKVLHFSGVIEEETIEEALQAMQMSQHFSYYFKDSTFWIGN